MREWDVDMEFRASTVLSDVTAESIVELLQPFGGAVSYRDNHLSARATVQANDPDEALHIARDALACAATGLWLNAVQVREAAPIVDGERAYAAS